MSGRADYLIQVLEKIGSPLMSGVIGAPEAAQSDDTAAEAQKIASLLSSSVKFSIDIGNLIDINSAGSEGDRLRIALTALASPLVGEYFRQHGRAPDEAQIKKMGAALQAVISFSDNFTPDKDSTRALEEMAAKTLESGVNYIEAMVPVVSAVGAFAFGQSEAKLLQDVSSKLSASAGTLGAAILSKEMPQDERKKAELALLRSLAHLYADAHNGEVQKLMALDESKRMSAQISADTVWSVFETRQAMLQALAENMVPGGANASAASVPVSSAPAAEEKPSQEAPAASPFASFAEKPAQETPPASPPPSAPPTASETPPAPPPAEKPAANPMAMFAKKPSGDTPPAAPPAEVPPQAPPEVPENQAPSTPAEPPAPPTEIPPPPGETPPAAPAQDTPPEKPADKPSGNPMSFFKAPPKKEEGDDNA